MITRHIHRIGLVGGGDTAHDRSRGCSALVAAGRRSARQPPRGNDTLTGGAGADRFSGGAGTDRAIDLHAAQRDTQDGTVP